MSLSAVHSSLSSLKSCQADIGTGMDIVTDVALDLVESRDGKESAGLKKLEATMLECARLDREINCFVEVVQNITTEARQMQHQHPEALFTLSAQVKEKYTEVMSRVNDAELHNHPKVVSFKDGVHNSIEQANPSTAEDMEEDLDVAVTQSQVNFTCPLTQMEMENPVKNRKCNHHYEQQAILDMIRAKHAKKKMLRCPKVGCGNGDVKKDDLMLDPVMKRMIQNHKRQNSKT